MTAQVDDFLEHFGTKGMKWGVRRADKKWEKKQMTHDVMMSIYNQAWKEGHKELIEINKRHANKNVKDSGPERTAYRKEFVNTINKRLNTISAQNVSPSGNRRLSVKMGGDNNSDIILTVSKRDDVSHSLDGEPNIKLVVEEDFNGFITKISLPDEATMPTNKPPMDVQVFLSHYGDVAMQSSTDEVDDILEHFGTKGMQWGVRTQKRKIARAQKDIIKTAAKQAEVDKIYGKGVVKILTKAEADAISRADARRTQKSGRDLVLSVLIPFGSIFVSKVLLHDGMVKAEENIGQTSTDESEQEVDDILEHFGTKGMRWGVRKAAGAGARGVGRGVGAGARGVGRFAKNRVTKTVARRKEVHTNRPHAMLRSPKKARGRTVFKTGPKHLTDEELRTRIARLEMEKKYLDLNNRDLQKGKSAVGRVLSSSGETVGKTATTAVLTYAVKKAFETGGGKHGGEIAKDIFVKKKGK